MAYAFATPGEPELPEDSPVLGEGLGLFVVLQCTGAAWWPVPYGTALKTDVFGRRAVGSCAGCLFIQVVSRRPGVKQAGRERSQSGRFPLAKDTVLSCRGRGAKKCETNKIDQEYGPTSAAQRCLAHDRLEQLYCGGYRVGIAGFGELGFRGLRTCLIMLFLSCLRQKPPRFCRGLIPAPRVCKDSQASRLLRWVFFGHAMIV
ncbi:hypothetical protein F5Y12DRAFT_710022 [Xylaria sp. FL1777]|nr:hypothetical protein F5Y12DRAFT_710022 [Xylaria sp. FL1777]